MEVIMPGNSLKIMLTTIMLATSSLTVAPIGLQAAHAEVPAGGAKMYPNKNIIQNAVNSKDHTTLVAAVKAAGLVQTLEGPGPFTVFAPTNAAFAKLPKGAVETLLKPESKSKLVRILTSHVVPGEMSGKELIRKIKQNGGKYEMKTVSGDTLAAELQGKKLYIVDKMGGRAQVTIPDLNQSNGVIHVVNAVLLPE